MLEDISTEVMALLNDAILMKYVIIGRAGLNIDFKISVDGKTGELLTVYMPF